MKEEKMKKILLGFLISFLSLFYSFSQELKIGYVDVFKVFNEYEKTKEYDGILEKRKEEEEKKLSEKREEIEKMQSKLSLLKEEEQEKEREKIVQATKEYKDLENEIFIKLKEERDEKMKEIIKDIDKIIRTYAEEEGFDLIVNETAVLYGKEPLDITSQILEKINKNYLKKR